MSMKNICSAVIPVERDHISNQQKMIHNLPDLVGITGLKQSGKNTAAAALVEKLGYTEDAFARNLKDIVYSIQGMSVRVPAGVWHMSEDLYLPYQTVVDGLGLDLAKELVPDVRRILQTFGTEGMREHFGPDVWSDRVIARVAANRSSADPRPVVVTDVRFPDEADAIRDAGGLLVRIVRPEQGPVSDGHASETHIASMDVDIEIVNDGTVDDLRQRMTDAINSVAVHHSSN